MKGIMKRFRNVMAFLLTGALVASLAGCGASSGGGSSSPEEQGAVTESSETEASAKETGSSPQGQEDAESDSAGENAAGAKDRGTITFTYVKSPLNVPSIVEKDQQIFAEVFGADGYEVSYSDLTTGPEQTQALASGDIQFLNAVGATSVILSASNGADIKIISIYSRSPKAFKLFSSDEAIQSPEDLRGKKVAGPKGTILHELLAAYLASAGMTENDIEFMAMGIPDAQAALAGGSVDAALLAGPTAYNMEKDGFHVVTDGEGLTDATIVTATSQAFADEHPELLEDFCKAQKQILDYIDANFDAAMAAAAVETELTEDAVKEMYEMYDFSMEISDADIEAMIRTKDFMLESGMIEEDVDIPGLILAR